MKIIVCCSDSTGNDCELLLPRLVIVFSGKRKSGKDFVAEKLLRLIGDDEAILFRLSGPLKQQYAIEKNLDFASLLTSSSYKEKFREDMIKWGEAKRLADPDYFCNLACASGKGKRVWIISDARRPSDVDYFRQMKTNILLVRIEASDDVRRRRGWEFVSGIDDCDSECALDSGIPWDHVIFNNGGPIDNALQSLLCHYK